MTIVISHDLAAQIVGSEKELQNLILDSFSDEILQLRTGAKLFGVNRLGPNPVFEIRSGIPNSNGKDIQETIMAIEQGRFEDILIRNKKVRR